MKKSPNSMSYPQDGTGVERRGAIACIGYRPTRGSVRSVS
jgi:hypothetical protein